jgi:drug/metabolite transporter (DMT)-like permease
VLASFFWMVLGEVLFTMGISRTTLSNAAVLTLTLPLFTVSLGVLFLGEALSVRFLLAWALIVAGFALLITGKHIVL